MEFALLKEGKAMPPLHTFQCSYRLVLVLLSYLISVAGAYSSLKSVFQLRHARGRRLAGWLGASALAMGGGGVWSMHFIAMTACRLPVKVAYDPALTLASLLVAIVVIGIGLYTVGRNPSAVRLLAGGCIAGLGIAAMHYMGMAAMRLPARITYRPILVVASVLIAVGAALLAFWVAFNLRGRWQRVGSAFVMGGAVCGLHYAGMAATVFVPYNQSLGASRMVLGADELGFTSFWITLAVLALILTQTRITGARQAELALHESEETHRTLFESGPPKILYDPGTLKILAVNHPAIERYGYSAEEFRRMTIKDLRAAAEAGEPATRSPPSPLGTPAAARHLTKDGEAIYVEVTESEVLIRGRKLRLAIITDVTDRRLAEERLLRSYDALRALSTRLQSVREEESARIAREVHDELGQVLTALRLDLVWVQRRIESLAPAPGGDLSGKLESMNILLGTAMDVVQRIATELRPGVLDKLGLEAAVDWYVGEFEKRTGIACRIRSALEGTVLAPAISTALFRILQEALTNVARHAEAREVEIRLAVEEGNVVLAVTDDGRGIPPEKIADSQSLGLLGIRERARALGGNVVIRRAPAGGTTVEVTIPL